MSRDYIGYVSLICRFIATQNYKSSWDLHQQKQVGLDTWQPELVSLPGTDPWSKDCICRSLGPGISKPYIGPGDEKEDPGLIPGLSPGGKRAQV